MVEGDASKDVAWPLLYRERETSPRRATRVVTRPKAHSIGQRTPVSVTPGTPDAPLRGASSWGFF
jgi:hypothetical protein